MIEKRWCSTSLSIQALLLLSSYVQVVESAEKSGNRNADREHLVTEKLVRDCRKKKVELKVLPRTARSQWVGVKPCWPELEDNSPVAFLIQCPCLGWCNLYTSATYTQANMVYDHALRMYM